MFLISFFELKKKKTSEISITLNIKIPHGLGIESFSWIILVIHYIILHSSGLMYMREMCLSLYSTFTVKPKYI